MKQCTPPCCCCSLRQGAGAAPRLPSRAQAGAGAGAAGPYLPRKGLPMDWDGLEKLPNTRWAPLPPTMLKNCAPDGGCFTRTGSATLGGRTVPLMVTGARTMVLNLYFRNTAAPFGEAAVIAALKQHGSRGRAGRAARSRAGPEPPTGTGEGCQGLAGLSRDPDGDAAPSRAKDSSCPTATSCPRCNRTSSRTTASSARPARYRSRSRPSSRTSDWPRWSSRSWSRPRQRAMTGLLSARSRPGLSGTRPRRRSGTSPRSRTTPTRWRVSGHAEYSGRKFSALASGTATQPKNIYLEEMGHASRAASTCWAWSTRRASRCGWCAAGRSTPSRPTTGTASTVRRRSRR